MTNPAPLEVILDLERAARIGLPEAVLCEPKSTAHLISILETLRDTKRRMLFTRLSQAAFDALPIRWKKALDFDVESNTAYYGTLSSAKVERNISRLPQVAIVCAGTSDSRVVKECHRTLKFSNVSATCIFDVGVAGLWRLQQRLEHIRQHKIVIVVAGMDAALPSVLGGLIQSVIIAVPTSTGYGVAAGGHSALHSMLASCAQGITVVNIDNGYGAACAALRLLGNFK
jgi:pyridinium-3,5-biscarboxylic acid mononucleotide synthase